MFSAVVNAHVDDNKNFRVIIIIILRIGLFLLIKCFQVLKLNVKVDLH